MINKFKKTFKKIGIKGQYSVAKNKFLLKIFPFKSPTILLLSYPRGGSSWIGRVLSTSDSVAYLREPITQTYLMEKGGKNTLIDINKNSHAASIYQELGDNFFQGIPAKNPNIVNQISDFSIFKRSQKQLLIKEVNPKATEFYCQRYNPIIILILRHPAAVASSFSRQGWLNSPDTQLDTGNPGASIWEKFGYAYGSSLNSALETLGDYRFRKSQKICSL